MKANQASVITNWHKPTLWAIVAFAAVFLIASFTSNGHGMFGWGLMAGVMWLWLIVSTLLVALLVVSILDRRADSA